MVSSQLLPIDFQRPPVQRLCLVIPALFVVQPCQVIETTGGVLILPVLPVDRERPLKERLCLSVSALSLIESGQVAQTNSQGIRLVLTPWTLVNREHPLKEGLCLVTPVLLIEQLGQVIQADRRVGMLGPSARSRIARALLYSGSASA